MTRSEMADGLRWVGGYRAVSWRADGLRGGSPDVAPCVADGLWRVGRWRAEGRRMLRRKQADGAWRVGELPTEGAQGLYLAR